jgi:hypothetical protein
MDDIQTTMFPDITQVGYRPNVFLPHVQETHSSGFSGGAATLSDIPHAPVAFYEYLTS